MCSKGCLTVAIPTYQGSKHVEEALRGILAQDMAEFELIVSDDRSEDDTLRIVRECAGDRAHIEVNSERLGLAGNWNRCIERARTDFVLVFHQDDVMLPGHLAAQQRAILAACRKGIPLGLIANPSRVIDDKGGPIDPRIIPDSPPPSNGAEEVDPSCRLFRPGEYVSHLAESNPLRCSAVTTSRAAHAAVGGFRPDYRYVVDWDFWFRVARAWSVAWIVGPPTVAIRWHGGSETHRFKSGTEDLDEQRRLLAEIQAGSPGLPTRRRDRRLARAYLNRAYDAAHASDRVLLERALRTAVALQPGILGRVALDPRLAARLAWTWLTAPRAGKDPAGSRVSRGGQPCRGNE